MQNRPSSLNSSSTFDPTGTATLPRASGLWLVALGTLLLAGCAGPITRPSPIMQKSVAALEAPPAEWHRDPAAAIVRRWRAEDGLPVGRAKVCRGFEHEVGGRKRPGKNDLGIAEHNAEA